MTSDLTSPGRDPGQITLALGHQVVTALHSLAAQDRPMVLAVSGGPDSVALAVAVTRASKFPHVLAHLNHAMRGAESDQDEKFVHELWQRLARTSPGLKLRVERIDIPALARDQRQNTEAAARHARYCWLRCIAREEGLDLVATGHSANDQAETVLHHLIRGTGVTGLRGLAPKRRLSSDVYVIRPLLQTLRKEVLEYLTAMGESYCEDCSNNDVSRMRNRIRHRLVPMLERRFSPAVVRHLCDLADQARAAQEAIRQMAAGLLAQAELPRAGPQLILDANCLGSSSRHLVREAFRLLWYREGWPLGRMGFAEWDRLAELVGLPSGKLQLPGGIGATRIERVVQLRRAP